MKLILAVDKNWSIGNQGRLLYHLPGDLKHFKQTTMGGILIMGRKTYESLPGKLPGREMVVLSRAQREFPGAYHARSIHELWNILEKIDPGHQRECFVIGGAQTVERLLPWISEAIITMIDRDTKEVDARIEALNPAEWKLIRESIPKEENGISYRYQFYEKSNPIKREKIQKGELEKMDLIERLKRQVKEVQPSIVFPEGTEPRILGAAERLQNEGILIPILLGGKTKINEIAYEHGYEISKIRIINPKKYPKIDNMVAAFMERRKGKVDEETAYKMLMTDENYFGTMLVYMGKADGLVSGAIHSTADTVRPALQIVKTRPEFKKVAGAFILRRGEQLYIFADGGVNIEPSAEDLAECAIMTAETAKRCGMDPKVAMLSFSSKGSAFHEEVTKVQEATRIAREKAPDLVIDGELQFDAAFVPTVAKLKAPDSEVAGHANVFIFPNIAAGNIGYKIAQRLGGFAAIGPVLQGLNAPINDLSRGCVEQDVYELAILTAALM